MAHNAGEPGPQPARTGVVLFDDGSVTAAGLSRIARYASTVDLVGGTRQEQLTAALASSGSGPSEIVTHPRPRMTLGDACDLADRLGRGVIATGVPLDPETALAAFGRSAGTAGSPCTILHVLSPVTVDDATVTAVDSRSASWCGAMSAALTELTGLRARPASGTGGAQLIAESIRSALTDHLVIARAVSFGRPEPAAAGPALPASGIVHTRLTDSAIEITNRTPLDITIEIVLADAAGVSLTTLRVGLAAADAMTVPYIAVPALADRCRPVPVLRHWSHESETVYEGGDIRITELIIAADAFTEPVRKSGGRGLVVAAISSELAAAIGSRLDSLPLRWGSADEHRYSLRTLLSDLATS